MSSILNSISSGELQVQHVPEVKPVKEDSIIDLLQNSEIEFDIYKKPNPEPEPELEFTFIEESIPTKEDLESKESLEDLFENSDIQITTCPDFVNDLENVNTGFGDGNDLHYEDPCKIPELKTPLYQENYLHEFATEEEKAAARHALGLYNKGDVVAMSLLTAEDDTPTKADWSEATTKQLRKGDKFFSPFVLTKAVYNSKGVSLDASLNEINSLIIQHQKSINEIIQVSNLTTISSLGDVRLFLQGFNNGDNLHNTLTTMDKEMLRFEKTGQIQ